MDLPSHHTRSLKTTASDEEARTARRRQPISATEERPAKPSSTGGKPRDEPRVKQVGKEETNTIHRDPIREVKARSQERDGQGDKERKGREGKGAGKERKKSQKRGKAKENSFPKSRKGMHLARNEKHAKKGGAE